MDISYINKKGDDRSPIRKTFKFCNTLFLFYEKNGFVYFWDH